MHLDSEYILKVIILINAQNNGWKIKYYDYNSFYLVRKLK